MRVTSIAGTWARAPTVGSARPRHSTAVSDAARRSRPGSIKSLLLRGWVGHGASCSCCSPAGPRAPLGVSGVAIRGGRRTTAAGEAALTRSTSGCRLRGVRPFELLLRDLLSAIDLHDPLVGRARG